MLSLNPPYLLVGNLMIFRDNKDETVFYYAPQQPSIRLGDDGKPAISAYAIIPETGVGVKNDSVLEAGLTVDIELTPSEKDLADAEEAVEKQFGVRSPVFSPAPLHSGLVRLTMAQSGENPEEDAWYVSSGISPSLVGNNNVSLMARVTGEDAKSLIAAIDAGSVPASVYYELKTIGVTPVYHAWLKADKAAISHHFEKKKKDSFIFYSNEISEMVDELKTSDALEIVVEELDPDIKAAAEEALFNDLKNKVLEEFFQPIEIPTDEEKSDNSILGEIGGLFSGLVKSILPQRSYLRKTVDVSREETIEINLSKSNAKLYTYYPQALLKTMIDQVGAKPKEYISWIDEDNLSISREVSVRVAADAFQSANLKSLEVTCRVIDANSGEVLTTVALPHFEADSEKTNVFNYHRQKGVNYAYEYQVTLLMASDSRLLPDLLTTPWIRVESPYIYINPAEYYADYDVDVYMEDLSIFDHCQMLQMDVSASVGDEERPVFTDSFSFKRDKTDHKRFSLVANRDTDLRYQLRLTYFLANQPELTLTFNDVKGPLFFVPNPFENEWSVDLRCVADWDKYEKIYVPVRVNDPERSAPIKKRFVFTKDFKDQVLNVSTSLKSPEGVFEYLVEALPANGAELLTAGWYTHDGRSVMIVKVMDDFIPTRVVRARLKEALDFQKWKIKYVEVSVRFPGEEEGTTKRLNSADDVVEWVHPIAEGEPKTIYYKVKLKAPSGYKTKWLETESDDILFSIDTSSL